MTGQALMLEGGEPDRTQLGQATMLKGGHRPQQLGQASMLEGGEPDRTPARSHMGAQGDPM